MLQNLPHLHSRHFLQLTTIATVIIFHLAVKRSTHHSKWASFITGGIVIWMILHGTLAYNEFFITDLQSLPPRPLSDVYTYLDFNAHIIHYPQGTGIY